MKLAPTSNVAILGFGARARAFAALLAPRGCALRAWDPLLGGGNAAAHRARIEAAGVDACADLASALRGARLVVLDTVPGSALPPDLPTGQDLLDLAASPPARIEAALAALGVQDARSRWEQACAAARAAADSFAGTAPLDAVPRGGLP